MTCKAAYVAPPPSNTLLSPCLEHRESAQHLTPEVATSASASMSPCFITLKNHVYRATGPIFKNELTRTKVFFSWPFYLLDRKIENMLFLYNSRRLPVYASPKSKFVLPVQSLCTKSLCFRQ